MELVQVAQRATNLQRAADFYADLTGTSPTGHFEPPGLVFFALGGVRLLLDSGAPSSLLYLRVEDVDAEVNRLRAKGVEIETEPHVIFTHQDDALGPTGTDEWMAFVRDSEANLIGLVEHRLRI